MWTNPVNGSKSPFVGAHASHIVGWQVEEGRALLKELTEFATRPTLCHRHEWRAHDVLVWYNRCCLHRARPYDNTRQRRLMQRTTVASAGPMV